MRIFQNHGASRDIGSRGHALAGCLAVCATVLWAASGIASANAAAQRCESVCEHESSAAPPLADPPAQLPRPCEVLEPAEVESIPGLDAAEPSWQRHESQLPQPLSRQRCAWGAGTADGPRLSLSIATGDGIGAAAKPDAHVRPVAEGRGAQCDVEMSLRDDPDTMVEMSLSTVGSERACGLLEDLAGIVTKKLS